jgi:glycosyltransferase involved in cell wall biosynthesis
VPSVSVIVPIFNSIEHLAAFFESLAAALPDDAQVIVVDDASTQPVLEAISELPRAGSVVRLRNESNVGIAASTNRAFDLATGEIVVQLNSDLVLDAACITAMIALITAAGGEAGVVGSKLVYPTTGRTQSVGMAFGLATKRHVFRHLPVDHALCCRTRETQIVAGATVAMTRRVLGLLGPLDDQLYNHNPDIDHCLRAAEHRLRNFMCAESVAYHWRNRCGPIRYARVEAAEAAFWSKWGNRFKVDLGTFFDEALDHLLATNTELERAPFVIVDLTRSADQGIAIEQLGVRWEGIGQRVRHFRQMSNDSTHLELPLLLPHWVSHEPTPFIYLVDSHSELDENAMWFTSRRQVVSEEIIVDLSASACTTSEFVAWPTASITGGSIENIVDVRDP